MSGSAPLEFTPQGSFLSPRPHTSSYPDPTLPGMKPSPGSRTPGHEGPGEKWGPVASFTRIWLQAKSSGLSLSPEPEQGDG